MRCGYPDAAQRRISDARMALAQSQGIRFRGTNRRFERAAVVTVSPTIEAEVALI